MRVWATLAFALCAALSLGAAEPEFAIAKFKYDRPAAFTYTFDDGSRDQLEQGVPLLDRYGFKGSFYLVVLNADRGTADRERKDKWLNWEEWKQIPAAGHEVGNHSLNHHQLTKLTAERGKAEVNEPIEIIRKHLGVTVETFCCPGNAINDEVRSWILENHYAITEGRVSFGGPKFTTADANRYLDQAIQQGRHTIAMIHGITPEGKAYQPFNDLKTFEDHLAYAKSREQEIWIAPLREVAAYKLLRDHSQLRVQPLGDRRWQLEILPGPGACGLRSELTIRVDAPVAEVRQGDRLRPVVKTASGSRFELDSAAGPATVTLEQ